MGNHGHVKFLVGVGIIVAGLLSGVFWVKAAYAQVAAKPGSNEGVGFGGTPVNVKDHSGAVVDFLQTYTLQSKWNSRAALASAGAAILASVFFLLGGRSYRTVVRAALYEFAVQTAGEDRDRSLVGVIDAICDQLIAGGERGCERERELHVSAFRGAFCVSPCS